MQSYTDADAQLTGRCKDRRKIANNTWLERRDDETIAVRLHQTDVVTYRADGSITLDTGGWFTVTTKDRMNRFSPFGVHSVRGEWYVMHRNPDYNPEATRAHNGSAGAYWLDKEIPYRDGMTWDGHRWEGVPDDAEVQAERIIREKLKKDINAFVKSITPQQIVRAFDNPGGDCLLCRFGEDDCLASHVDEHYFHMTLAYRAVADRGYPAPDVVMSMIYRDALHDRVDRLLTDSLRRFLKKRLIEGVAVR
jgi:hypothetical protein